MHLKCKNLIPKVNQQDKKRGNKKTKKRQKSGAQVLKIENSRSRKKEKNNMQTATIYERPQVQTMTTLKTEENPKKRAPHTRPNREKTLTPRDRRVLTWVGEMYAVRLDLLQKLIEREGAREITLSRAYKMIAKYKEMGLCEYERILGTEPLYIWLTPKGLREVGLSDYSYQAPSLMLIKHYHAVTLVRFALERKNPTHTWKSERAIRGEVASIDAKERKNKHVADGLIISPEGKEIAIEAELTRKREQELQNTIFMLYRDFASIVYYCTDKTLERVKAETTARNEQAIREGKAEKFIIRLIADIEKEVGITL